MADKASTYAEQLRKLEREFEESGQIDPQKPIFMQKLKTLESLLAALMVNVSYSSATTEGIPNPNQLLVQCRLLARRIEGRKAECREKPGNSEENPKEWEEFGQRIEKVQEKLGKLSDLLGEAQSETAHYKSLSTDLKSQLKDQKDLFSTQSLALQESQLHSKSLSDQLSHHQSQIPTLEASISSLQLQNAQSEATITDLKSTMDKLQQAFQGEIGRMKQRFDSELEQARVMWEKQTVKISELSPSYLDLRRKLELEIGVNSEMHARLTAEVHDSMQLREECTRLQHRIDHLTAQLAAKTQDLHLLDLALTQAVHSEQESYKEREDGRVKELEKEVETLRNTLRTEGVLGEAEIAGKRGEKGKLDEMESWIEAFKSEK